MPAPAFSPLLAVHISDGVLAPSWLAGGFLLAALLALRGGWRIRDEEIPRVALLSAAFFIISLLHVPLGPTRVHLLLTGLVGVLLGWRAALAVPVGLFLQAVLLHHGGLTSLGVNSCIMVLPALLAWKLFGLTRTLPWVRRPWFRSALVAGSTAVWVLSLAFSLTLLLTNWDAGRGQLDFGPALATTFHPLTLGGALAVSLLVAWAERRLGHAPEFPVGLLVGEVAVLATALLNCLALVLGGEENFQTVALAVLVAHLPIAVVEGVILGFTVGFLARVRPDLLDGERPAGPEPERRPAGPERRVPVKSVGCLLAVAAGLLVPAGEARAHALMVDCEVLPGQKVRVSSWYSARPKSFPAQEARVRVYGPDNRLLTEGQTDDKGLFEFSYPKPEPLTVEVYQLGHRQTVALFQAAADGIGPAAPKSAEGSGEVFSSAGQHEQSVVRDVLIGVGFLLALAAFVLSLRNARRLRALQGPEPPP
jgi:cobalt/nickel transport system permease protein